MTIRTTMTGAARHALPALALMAAVLTASGGAYAIDKGALVLRSGQVDMDASYKNESTDANDRLQSVSALCSPGKSNKSKSAALIGTDKTRATTGLFAGVYGATQASTIVKLGGHLVAKPLKRNKNHCEIGGLTVSQIKGVWTMCSAANGCP